MKHIKQFEEINNTIEIGDYVVLNDTTYTYNSDFSIFSNFINNNVGRISNITLRVTGNVYDIDYFNVPTDLHLYFSMNKNTGTLYDMSVPEDEIIFSSKSKNDAELYIQTNKYNL